MLIRLAYFLGKRIVLPHWLHAIAMCAMACIGINLLIEIPFLAAAIIIACFLPGLVARIIWSLHRRKDRSNHSIIKGKVVGEPVPWRIRVLKAWNRSRIYTFESLMFMVVVILLNVIWGF